MRPLIYALMIKIYFRDFLPYFSKTIEIKITLLPYYHYYIETPVSTFIFQIKIIIFNGLWLICEGDLFPWHNLVYNTPTILEVLQRFYKLVILGTLADWPCPPKLIIPTCRKVWCLSACQKSISSLPSCLRYWNEVYHLPLSGNIVRACVRYSLSNFYFFCKL